MLQFILGTSGTGKTTYAKNIIADLRRKGEDKLLMLVPETIFFETESSFFDMLGPQECRQITVASFARLCTYVFSTTGNMKDNVIDDGIRSIIMSKTLEEVSDNLTVFNSKNTRKSILDLMLHSLKECKKDSITPDMLNNVSNLIQEENLKLKLKETALVLDAYDAITSKTYIDPLDDLTRLKYIIDETNMFDGYTVVVDSFSGFTYQQLEVLEVIMRQCKDFYITLHLDTSNSHLEIFDTTSRTKRAIKRIASNNNIQVKPNLILDKNYRFASDELAFLNDNIFRYSDEIFENKAENIHTYLCDNIYNEVEFVCKNIKRLIVEESYSYNDIAVVTRDFSKYIGVLDVALEKYNIPFFMNIPKDIYTSPVVRFISSAIDSVIYNFDRENILTMLKTGLTTLTELEISEFENYIYTWNINNRNLCREFTDNPLGFQSLTDSAIHKLELLESVRKTVIIPLENFVNSCKNTSCVNISKAIYNLLQDFNIENTIVNLYDNLEKQGLIFEAKEQVRIYNLLMETFDKIVAVAGDDNIDLKKYKEYFDYKLQTLSISDIPRYQDQLLVGVIDRVRLNDVKAVFVIGAIEGEFPRVPKTAGVFSENERRLLIQKDLPLTDSLEDMFCHEKYLAYCALTFPSEKLYITAYTSDYSGGMYTPSEIFTSVVTMFPQRKVTHLAEINEYNELWSEQQAFEVLSKNFRENNSEVSALKSYFSDSRYSDLIKKISSSIENKPIKIYDKTVAEKLFSKNLRISASQLELYNLCAFQYFCSYGLKVKERQRASIDAVQIGNVVHYFMEVFLKKYNKQSLNELSTDEIKNSIDEILTTYADENFGGLENKSQNFLNLYDRLKHNIYILLKEVIKQLLSSDFVPTDFELSIKENGDIPEYKVMVDENSSVSVTGYIDRVDTMDKSNNELYVRVVDYKTGNKMFKLSEILYGINMQMLIYLKAVTSNGKNYYGKDIIPTGILYMPSFAEEIDADLNTTKEQIEKKVEDNFRMNGLLLDDSRVLEAMDSNGNSIKFKRKSKGSIFSDNLATQQQFEYIFNHIDDVLVGMAKDLWNGEVSPSPLKGIKNGCAYCPYDSVCGNKLGDSYKFRQEKTADQVYQSLGMEVKKENEC